MIAIKIEFPSGRWHATAWGSHVNEGVGEWPPCPWRLCRALIAAWHWKHRLDEPTLRSLIDKLAAAPSPEFRLPKASTAHTRHFMPVVTGPKESRTKVFDSFVHVSAEENLWIRWDVELAVGERALLAMLLESLTYMGRAESLVSASLSDVLPVGGQWTAPIERGRLPDPLGEPVRLLAPQSPAVYIAWLAHQAPASSKPKNKRASDPLPDSIYSALQLDTADWRKDGWNLPPGAHWVEYSRPRNSLGVSPRGTSPQRHLAKQPTVARFALVSKVPPAITQALSLGERFHQALCSRIPTGKNSPTLTGCDDTGAPLASNEHVYFLPECDAHGYITHMTLHAQGGFDEFACRAFGQLREVWGSEGFEVRIVLLATGQPDDFALAAPYFRKARTWVSLTPFVPVRHAKATRTGVPKIDPANFLQIGSPEHDCGRLIETIAHFMGSHFGIKKVTTLGNRIRFGLRDIPCMDFQRQRRTGNGVSAGKRGYALRVEFNHDVSLPFGFGYGAHFGLGAFAPVIELPVTPPPS